MKNFLHILCIICLVLLLHSCSEGPRVIPRGKMSKIYAEMLVTDQWVNFTPSVMRMADTSLVYEPILEKYGYTSADYRKSIEYYMDDPERFAKILRTTSDMLGKKLDELNKLKKAIEESVIEIKTDFRAEEFFPYLQHEPYIHYYDSLSFECDTMGCYRVKSIERSDTIFDGLTIIIRADSLAVKDSLKLHDSVVVNGSKAINIIDKNLIVPIKIDTAMKIVNDDKYFRRISNKIKK